MTHAEKNRVAYERKKKGLVKKRIPSVVKFCKRCGKEFITKKYGTKYCTNRCRTRKDKRIQRRGEPATGIPPTAVTPFFSNYKTPLKEVPKGFGYEGVLITDETKDYVQCHICGWYFKNLSHHVRQKHELSAAQYKNRFKLSKKTALIGETLRAKRIEMARISNARNPERLKKAQAAYRKWRKENPRKGYKWALEKRNKSGTCPDQLIQKIRVVHMKMGKVPSLKDFKIYYDWRYYKSVIRVFGSWNKAVAMAGLKPNRQRKAFEPEELLEYLRIFYKKYGRPPSYSDMNRGFMPSRYPYQRIWGTLSEARQAAGIPEIKKGFRGAMHRLKRRRKVAV